MSTKKKQNKSGKTFVGKDLRRKTVDATKAVTIKITQQDIDEGIPGDPMNCVLAKGWQRVLGDLFEFIKVGTNITKIFVANRVIRYMTPAKVRVSFAIPGFDRTRDWKLPVGEYTWRPPVGTYKLGGHPRWHKVKNSGGIQSSFEEMITVVKCSRTRCIGRNA